MKKSDSAALIVISSLSVLVAYFMASAVIGSPNSQTTSVKTIDAISAEVVAPDASIFNADAINPTVEVVIGDNQNQ